MRLTPKAGPLNDMGFVVRSIVPGATHLQCDDFPTVVAICWGLYLRSRRATGSSSLFGVIGAGTIALLPSTLTYIALREYAFLSSSLTDIIEYNKVDQLKKDIDIFYSNVQLFNK